MGRTARRRSGRPDDVLATASSITQSNSTAQIFMGQRQNRWMQHEGHPADEAGASSAAYESSSRDSRVAEAEYRPTADAPTPAAHHQASLSRASLQPVPGTLTASANAMSRGATHLPSPAAMDENTSSPMAGYVLNPTLPHPGRSMPAAHSYGYMYPSSGPPDATAHHVSMPRQHPHQKQPVDSALNFNASENPLNAHGRNSPAMPRRLSVQGQSPRSLALSDDISLSRETLLLKLGAFTAQVDSKQAVSDIDRGRLGLLRAALEKGDLFCVALCQIHALGKSSMLLPTSALSLDAHSFQCCDALIATNDALSPVVLEWLRNFPLPITILYAVAEMRKIYDPWAKQAVEFLRLLPQHWDRIVAQSMVREGPPLVEDLHHTLHLYSSVLQATAFRAIARMFFEQGDLAQHALNVGLDHLEKLHQMDQTFFRQTSFKKRNPDQKGLAYRAFSQTMQAWKEHERLLRLLPQHQQPPRFEIPPNAIMQFQVRIAPPGQTFMPYQTTSLQRAPIHASGQTLAQLPRANAPSPTMPAPNAQPPSPLSLLRAGLVFPLEQDEPRPQPTNPDPSRSALHQAHLRSPRLGPIKAEPGSLRLYRYVFAFAMSPTMIMNGLPIQIMTFTETEENVNKIATTEASDKKGEPPKRRLGQNFHTYRLRCASYPSSGFPNEARWMEADNYWPEDLFLEFNDIILEPRRKLHHNRHLPIDLSMYIKSGENKIKAMINRASTDPRPFNYVLAVEIVSVMSHEDLKHCLKSVSAADSLNSITKSLTGGQDDDELSITSSNLTIKLFDPYSAAKIFDIPVRGRNCAHRDCFDLESFLRACKRERPGWPTIVDCWRCPLCRGDVRPQHLIIDHFLVRVREELEKRGLLDTRAIVVDAQGRWQPKEDIRTGVRSPSLDREEHNAAPKFAEAIDVIEID